MRTNKTWQSRATEKVDETMSKIPTEWRLSNSDLEQAKQRRKLTGAFIESFLDEEELEIVRTDSVPLVERLAYGRYNAKQVVRAFCKTAAMAHQIVGLPCECCSSVDYQEP